MTNTYYINYKTNKKYILTKIDEETDRAVITDENGDHHLVKLTTLKKTYKKVIEEVEEKQPETKETKNATGLNRHQELAKKQLTAAYNWVVGGYENDVADGNLSHVPPVEGMFDAVYTAALNEDVGIGYVGGKAKTELRFAGKEFCLKTLAKLFRADGYEVPESCYTIKPKTKLEGPRKNIKGNLEDVKKGQAVMVAFTGMVIGVFDIKKETSKTITVKTVRGDLKFDKATGLQLNADNPKFANRLTVQG